MTDLIIMRVIDVALAFPYILLALAIVATIGLACKTLIAIGLAYTRLGTLRAWQRAGREEQ